MFVKSVLIPKEKVVSVNKDISVKECLRLLNDHQIDGMPVISNDHYVGLVTKNALFEAAFHSDKEKNAFMDSVSAGEVAVKFENTLKEDDVFEETVIKMKDVPLVAVVDDRQHFLGIVTRFDVLEQFQSAFGMHRKGVRIVLTSIESKGRILRLAELTNHFQQNIISLATFDDTDTLVRRIVIKVVQDQNTKRFIERLSKNGFKLLDIKETK